MLLHGRMHTDAGVGDRTAPARRECEDRIQVDLPIPGTSSASRYNRRSISSTAPRLAGG